MGRPQGLRRLLILITALLTVSTDVASAVSADAVEDDPKSSLPVEEKPFSYLPPGTLEKMREQAPQKRAADKIQEAVVRLVGNIRTPQGTGFAGIEIDRQEVRVWWKGAPPPEISNVIAEARADAPVTITEAAYSRAELRVEAEKLAKQMRKNPQGTLHQVDIKGDGSGIVAITETNEVDSGLARTYSAIADIRVPLTTKQQPRMQSAGRLNATNPFHGGARISGQGANGLAIRCTAGWPVQGRTTGYWFLVTAAHCGYDGQYWWNGNFTQGIGYATGERTYEDVMLIRMTGPATSPVMWDGGVSGGANTGPEHTKFVNSWAHTTPGEYLCTSGSFSGAVCNWQVRGDFPYSYCAPDEWGTYECRGDMFVADQIYGVPGCRSGDSGGPVFSLSSDHSRVIAEGIISSCSDGAGSSVLGFQDYATVKQVLDVLIY